MLRTETSAQLWAIYVRGANEKRQAGVVIAGWAHSNRRQWRRFCIQTAFCNFTSGRVGSGRVFDEGLRRMAVWQWFNGGSVIMVLHVHT